MPWIEKYKPRRINEVLGQDAAIKKIIDFIDNFKKQKKKSLLLYGPTGTGKTSCVHAIAKELDLEIVEVNASDIRNKDGINSVVGAASSQMSLFFKRKVILVDELDGMAGREDYGGISALAALVGKNAFPIIFTANEPYEQKFSDIRKKADLVEFKSLENETIAGLLKKICDNEGIKHDSDDLKAIARRSGGDLRSAINDLQTITNDKKELNKDAVKELSDRDRTETISSALLKVFKTTNPNLAVAAFDNINEDIDKSFMWIDENLPYEYTKPQDLARAFDYLSKSDVFKGRIQRRQDWRYLVYCNSLMTSGVAVSKEERYKTMITYKPTSRILKIWIANQRFLKRKSIAQKIAQKCHCSKKRALNDYFPYIRACMKKNSKMAEHMGDELELDNEEMEWLRK